MGKNQRKHPQLNVTPTLKLNTHLPKKLGNPKPRDYLTHKKAPNGKDNSSRKAYEIDNVAESELLSNFVDYHQFECRTLLPWIKD